MKTQENDILTVNGYKIRFNELFKEWHVTHPEIGFCTYFKENEKAEAIEYCEKG